MAVEYKNAKVDLTTTNLTVLYTAPLETTAIIKSLIVVEDSNSADVLQVTLVNGSSIFNIYKDKAVGAKDTIELLTQPLVVAAGEIIKVQATTANRLHVVMSFMEVTSDTNNPL
jgi:hypothetical protein|tara:strand:- start:8 stop:349 length:342 start_codon:yes stop_codon:yes gene_type:complete